MANKIKSKKSGSLSRKSSKSRLSSLRKRKLRGGSPASDLVNQAANSPSVINDFVTSPRVRDGPMADNFGKQYGGSQASEMVMQELNNESISNNVNYNTDIRANMSSLNLYQPSGGSRRNKSRRNSNKRRSHKKHRKSMKKRNVHNSNKKGKTHKNKKGMKGGASDWMSSQYSLGSYNAPEMSASNVGQFSQSAAGSRADYMNPHNLGSAGSGYPMGSLEGANVHMTGAPLV